MVGLRAAWIEGSREYLSLLRWHRHDLEVDFQPVDPRALRHHAMGALLPSCRPADFGRPGLFPKPSGRLDRIDASLVPPKLRSSPDL